jgi:hypothetical protein
MRFMWAMALKAECTFIESQIKEDVLIACNEPMPQKPKDEKRIHAWGAAGYDFKLKELVFYDVESNKNGKMTQ